MSEQDTREQLEADAMCDAKMLWNSADECIIVIRGWLDRQAAITERELCSRCSPYATAKDYLDTIDKLTAELETYRNYAEQGECVKPQSEENGDTREQLEAWAYEEIAEKWARSDRDAALLFEDLYDLMDRMAAITRADYDVYLPQRVAELMGEVDSLTAEREQYRDNMLAQSRRVAELTAERDELQAAIDAMNNGQFYSMYKAKCEECEQLKKVVRTQAESFKKLECELAGKQ